MLSIRVSPRGTLLALSALVVIACAAVAAGQGVDRTIRDGALDWIHLRSESPSRDSIVVVREFDASGADLGTGSEGGGENHVAAAAMMNANAPGFVANEIARLAKELGPFCCLRGLGRPYAACFLGPAILHGRLAATVR
jgi:hypothetical protein